MIISKCFVLYKMWNILMYQVRFDTNSCDFA